MERLKQHRVYVQFIQLLLIFAAYLTTLQTLNLEYLHGHLITLQATSFISSHGVSSYSPFFPFQDSAGTCANPRVASVSFRLVTDPQPFIVCQNLDTPQTSVGYLVKHLGSSRYLVYSDSVWETAATDWQCCSNLNHPSLLGGFMLSISDINLARQCLLGFYIIKVYFKFYMEKLCHTHVLFLRPLSPATFNIYGQVLSVTAVTVLGAQQWVQNALISSINWQSLWGTTSSPHLLLY